jgi:SAM-dependent methyltransferase
MTASSVDGFSLESWHRLFQAIEADPQRFCDAMSSGVTTRWAGVDAELLRYQFEMRKKIARKFDEPERWVWSRDHLQLASDQQTADMVASHFPAGCRVADIGCGGGSDAVALARDRTVVAIDKNEFACLLARCNSSLQSRGLRGNLEVRYGAAEELDLDTGLFIHLDPDRRQDGMRSVQMKWHSPSLDTVKHIISSSDGGSIKLAPACADDDSGYGREITRQWISSGHRVVQQRWWWGMPSVPAARLWISSFSASRGWIHGSFDKRETSGPVPIVTDPAEIAPGMFIGDGDPALRASNTQGLYIKDKDCKLIGNESGFYLSTKPLELPLIRWHLISAILPLDCKRIKKAVRAQGLDGIELKPRNVRSVPDDLVKMSLQKGSLRATIFVFSIGRSHIAVMS